MQSILDHVGKVPHETQAVKSNWVQLPVMLFHVEIALLVPVLFGEVFGL
ncbi:uncharacterized protein G2W53_000949 [Senna tora]|uniref:Uncharacterized protein n=1 Tax=Senna tora TaxID=362788 RepID=A0A834XEZ5_9FABA|nr:uncharacterized protein G2W53_000949 [Senna tora]